MNFMDNSNKGIFTSYRQVLSALGLLEKVSYNVDDAEFNIALAALVDVRDRMRIIVERRREEG